MASSRAPLIGRRCDHAFAAGRCTKVRQRGEAVELTVGNQPYYTESWSGVVITGQELWKKYLPEGSEIEFQIGLQVAIIVGLPIDRCAESGARECTGLAAEHEELAHRKLPKAARSLGQIAQG